MTTLIEQNGGALSGEDLTIKYKKILESNGITEDVSEVIVKDAGLKGEGMTSETQYVTVKFKNLDAQPLNLFTKVLVGNPSHMQMVEDLKLFEKEATFLGKYVPAAEEFCKSRGLSGIMDFYPKLYYGDEKMTVLENLVLDKGYIMLDKEEKQDLIASKLAIENLAKHHAIAHAMIQQNGGPQKFFQRFPNLDYEIATTSTFRDMLEPTIISGLNTNIKLLEKHNVDGSEKVISEFKALLATQPYDFILNGVNAPASETSLMTINHGDYWSNNMMFRKDPRTNKLIHQVAIDFQATSYASFVLDLEYYFFTSVQTKVRQAHLQDLLKLYVNTVNKLASDLGHETNLNFEKVFLEFRKNVRYGLCFGICFGFGPVLAIMKDVDINEIEVSEFPRVIEELVLKWLENNSDQTGEIVEELISIMDEYRKLLLD